MGFQVALRNNFRYSFTLSLTDCITVNKSLFSTFVFTLNCKRLSQATRPLCISSLKTLWNEERRGSDRLSTVTSLNHFTRKSKNIKKKKNRKKVITTSQSPSASHLGRPSARGSVRAGKRKWGDNCQFPLSSLKSRPG